MSTEELAVADVGLVLVHGGFHRAACWEPTVAELRRLAPDLPVVTPDLPGRGSRPGDLMAFTVEACVKAVLEQIAAAGLDEVVLVGHSAAGLSLPAVMERLGAARVRRAIFISALVPPDGGALNDAVSGRNTALGNYMARRRKPIPVLPAPISWALFCRGMSREQRRFTFQKLCPESPRLLTLTVSRAGMPTEVPRTWVMPLRDWGAEPDAAA
jgi:pimeloyl-ACP methyl ester carboxylesterase